MPDKRLERINIRDFQNSIVIHNGLFQSSGDMVNYIDKVVFKRTFDNDVKCSYEIYVHWTNFYQFVKNTKMSLSVVGVTFKRDMLIDDNGNVTYQPHNMGSVEYSFASLSRYNGHPGVSVGASEGVAIFCTPLERQS